MAFSQDQTYIPIGLATGPFGGAAASPPDPRTGGFSASPLEIILKLLTVYLCNGNNNKSGQNTNKGHLLARALLQGAESNRRARSVDTVWVILAEQGKFLLRRRMMGYPSRSEYRKAPLPSPFSRSCMSLHPISSTKHPPPLSR
jgi:hypothetical protein